MLLAGDELGHTQHGNNNAYCQDNEISWLDWSKADKDLLKFTRDLIHFRKKHPAFSRKGWFKGKPVRRKGLTDIAWFKQDATEMTEDDWNTGFAKSLGIFLYGDGLHMVDENNNPIKDDSFYLIFNAHFGPLDFKLPPANYAKEWRKVLDTSNPPLEEKTQFKPDETIKVNDRSFILLQAPVIPVKD
jgi:glycogen operon protein